MMLPALLSELGPNPAITFSDPHCPPSYLTLTTVLTLLHPTTYPALLPPLLISLPLSSPSSSSPSSISPFSFPPFSLSLTFSFVFE